MAQIKLSQLPSSVAPSSSAEVFVVDGGVSYKTSILNIIKQVRNIDPLVHIPFKRQDDEVALSGMQTFTRLDTPDPVDPTLSKAVTYIDPLTNLVTRAALGAPRFERMADGGTGILLEGASTNLCTNSEVGVRAHAVARALGIAPDGTFTAENFVKTAVTSAMNIGHFTLGTPAAVGTVMTVSLYMKPIGNGASYGIQSPMFGFINMPKPELDPNAVYNPVTGYYRVQAQVTSTGNVGNLRIYHNSFSTSAGNGIDGNYVWGAQVEALPFASSYIPTTTAAVTRAADKLSLALSGNMSLMHNVSVIADCDFFNIASLQYQGILDSGGGNRFVFHTLANGTFQNYAGQSSWGGSISPDTVTRLAISNDTTKRSYQDGVLVTSISNQNTYEPNNPLLIGRFFNNTFPMYGHIRNFRIYDQALTSVEIAAA